MVEIILYQLYITHHKWLAINMEPNGAPKSESIGTM